MGTSVGRASGAVLPQSAVPALAAVVGLGAGVLLGSGVDAGREAALVALLQFMAVVKAAMVVGVVAGATWRLRLPASFRTALAYAAAGGIMAAGLWPIWVATHVATGAMLVHGGFAIAMATGWRDRAAWQVLMVKRR